MRSSYTGLSPRLQFLQAFFIVFLYHPDDKNKDQGEYRSEWQDIEEADQDILEESNETGPATLKGLLQTIEEGSFFLLRRRKLRYFFYRDRNR